jgi:hypothetical protein
MALKKEEKGALTLDRDLASPQKKKETTTMLVRVLLSLGACLVAHAMAEEVQGAMVRTQKR